MEVFDYYLVIDNVAIPMVLNDRFIAPDLEEALEYFSEFIRYTDRKWRIQGYLCHIMNIIDKKKPNGYTGNKALSEFLSYVGLERFSELMNCGSIR